jgi:hypothetical protein
LTKILEEEEKGIGNYCLLDFEFHFGKMKKFQRWMVVVVA